MHIPDGFINIPVSAGAFVLSLSGLTVAVRRTKKILNDRLIPHMGVFAAFIFAAQMFNFPVAAGTSGHLMGGVLASIVMGPMAASIAMTVVLIVQCIVFQDGGLLALGTNILNMAIVGTWLGWGVYKVISASSDGLRFFAGVFLGSWISVVAAASLCALELHLSNTIPLKLALPAMVGVHTIIGIGEGIITVAVVSFLKRVGMVNELRGHET